MHSWTTEGGEKTCITTGEIMECSGKESEYAIKHIHRTRIPARYDSDPNVSTTLRASKAAMQECNGALNWKLF